MIMNIQVVRRKPRSEELEQVMAFRLAEYEGEKGTKNVRRCISAATDYVQRYPRNHAVIIEYTN